MNMNTETRTEWAIRTSNDDGSTYTYHTHYTPGWGTRFQDPPVPYTKATATYAIENTTQYMRQREPVIVSREVVVVSTPWMRKFS